jgi:hypothetical protein
VLTIDSNLETATLEPVTLTLNPLICGDMGCAVGEPTEVTVGGRWTGVGLNTKSKDKRVFRDDDDCIDVSMEWLESRSAQATIDVDGETQSTQAAGMEMTRFTGHSNCNQG